MGRVHSRERHRADDGDRPHPRRRRQARPRLPGALHGGLAGVRALPARRERRPAEGCGVGGSHHGRCGGRDHSARPPSPRQARARCGLAFAAARRVWRATGLDGHGACRALGQIGLPGGGYNYALGAIAYYGRRYNAVPTPTLSQGKNGVRDFIPVARIADMLLNPGETYRYNGETRTYPDIKLVYWAGGNPFHHHQDLNRLRKAFARLDTLVVHELAWTATARHADIVLPCTMTLEREDIGGNANDPLLVPMQPVAAPYGEARDDYAIFADLAERLGAREAFTEGRSVRQWLEHLYEPTRAGLAAAGLPAPSFAEF